MHVKEEEKVYLKALFDAQQDLSVVQELFENTYHVKNFEPTRI